METNTENDKTVNLILSFFHPEYFTCVLHLLHTLKKCLKWPLKKNTKIGFQIQIIL